MLCFVCVHSSFAIILLGKIELVALCIFSSWCLMIVVMPFLALPYVCLQFVIVVFPDHTHLLFLRSKVYKFDTHNRHHVVSLSKTGYPLRCIG